MDIEAAYVAAQTLNADMPHLFTNYHFIREVTVTHPTNIELTDPDYDIFRIRCEDFILQGGTFGNPRLIQFDALGLEQDMIYSDKDELDAYYQTILNWPNIREEFLNKYTSETYWLYMWQALFQQNIGNRNMYSFDQLVWLANSQMPLGRKLLCLASDLIHPAEYQHFSEAPDMYLMTLMSVPTPGRYHQYKNNWQPEHGPFMPLKDEGLRTPIMHKLIQEGKVALTITEAPA